LKERTTKFRKRGELCRDYLKENLGILQMDGEAFKKLARNFRKKFILYWRIPINELDVIVLFDATTCPELSTMEYKDLDWSELCKTPVNKRYTGSLGYEKKEEKEKHDDDIIVDVPHIVVEGISDFQIVACREEALRWTDHLNPSFNEEEIWRACAERMDLFKKEIENAGGIIAHEGMRRMRVSSSSFSWIYNPDKMPTKENLAKRMGEKVLEYDQAVAELFFP